MINQAEAFLEKYKSGLNNLYKLFCDKDWNYIEIFTNWCKERNHELHSIWTFYDINNLGIFFNDASLIYFSHTDTKILTHKDQRDVNRVLADWQNSKDYKKLFMASDYEQTKTIVCCGGCNGTGKVPGFLMTTVYECGRCGGKGVK